MTKRLAGPGVFLPLLLLSAMGCAAPAPVEDPDEGAADPVEDDGYSDAGVDDPTVDWGELGDPDEEETSHFELRGRHSPQMGVNYNGQLDAIDLGDIGRTETRWVRGFIDVFLFTANPSAYDEKIAGFMRLKRRGYRTVLNIKWNFHGRSFPAHGSARMEQYKRNLRVLLDRVWAGTDIIVSGNEPFIESKRAERDERLVAFYREMTNFMIGYRRSHARKIPIYVGSFQNLHSPTWRIPAARGLLTFARNNRGVAGIDLHIHHSDGPEITAAFDYVHGKIRPKQRILVTEFSLMHQWRSHLGESIPRAFARSYGLPVTMRNFEYLDRVLRNPVGRRQWVDFLRQSRWFEARKRYLRNAYQQMSSFPKFFIATYGIRQSYPPNTAFTRTTDPWIVNALFANRTVPPAPDGSPRTNYAWMDDFHAIQRGAFD